MTRFNASAVATEIARAIRSVIGDCGVVPLHEPEFSGNEKSYMTECIETGWVSSVGAFVDRFETNLSELMGGGHVVACVNGTAALHLAFMALGIGPDDEILMPTLTFVATANAAAYTGAVPHFCDVESTRFGIDPDKLAIYLNDIAELVGTTDGRPIFRNRATGRRLRTLVVMHVFGHPVDMEGLTDVATRFGLDLIEDAAEALGSTYKGRAAGSIGRIGVLSFNGNKIITTGGGGAIYCNDVGLSARIRHLATTAKRPHRWAYEHDMTGFNYRLPNINAALGCAQLEQLSELLARKRRLAENYKRAFVSVNHAKFIVEPEDSLSNYWLNAIQLEVETGSTIRDAVLNQLHEQGLLCRPVWKLMHKLPMYCDCPAMDLSVAEALEMQIINIPSSAALAGI